MQDVPRKIAVVIPYYGLAGGAEMFAAELTERIARDPAYEMHVFAHRWRRFSDRVAFHRVPRFSFPRFLTTVSFAWLAGRRIAAVGCDLIHAHERLFVADLFTMHGTPHGYWTEKVRCKHPSLFDRATSLVEARLVANPRCRHFLAVSQLAAQAFRETYPLAGDKMEVLAPGVDLEKFARGRRDGSREAVRASYGIGGDDFLLLFVGHNFEHKGLEPLLRAMAGLVATPGGERLKLLVVGKGKEQKFRKLAAELGMADRLVFAGVVREAIEDIYGAADALAMLSDFDTFGMTVLEAMAASLPVLVSSRVGAKDLVREGSNGFVVERDDIAAITGCLASMLKNDRRREMAAAALAEARRHGWDILAARI